MSGSKAHGDTDAGDRSGKTIVKDGRGLPVVSLMWTPERLSV